MSRTPTKVPVLRLVGCLLLALLIVPGSAFALGGDTADRSQQTDMGIQTGGPSAWMTSVLDWLGQWIGLTSTTSAATTTTDCTTTVCDPGTTTTTGTSSPLPSGTEGGTTTDDGGHLDPWG